MRKLWLGTVLLLAVVGLMTTGCDKMMNPLEGQEGDVNIAVHPVCGEPKVVTIWAGQFTNAGSVSVTNCTESLFVKIQTTGGWKVSEAHVAVANSCAELPRNKKGHLVPGLFPINQPFDPPVTEHEFAIYLGDWEPGDTVCIAVHVVVNQYDECGKIIRSETGWADEWKGCFCYEIQECYKDVDLPTDTIRMRGWHPFAAGNSYWRIELADVPTGYDVWNGDQWKGWCAEENIHMNQNTWYRVRLYSSQDPNLVTMPRLYKNGEWDRVNWVLNHKSGYPTATWNHFQIAIWHLIGVRPGAPSDPLALSIYEDAVDNGDGYHPGPGGWVAVLVVDGPNTQLVFIEVDP